MTRLLQRRVALSAVTAVLLLAGGASADAGTTGTTFNVNASILPACSITAVDLNFGNYVPTTATALTGTTTLTINCTNLSGFTIALSVGSAAGSTFAPRHLASGANLMNYNLYTAAGGAANTIWGDGTASTNVVTGTGTGLLTPTTKTVYGQIPINQDLPVGTYASVITVTLTF